jgi:hypothetical protein
MPAISFFSIDNASDVVMARPDSFTLHSINNFDRRLVQFKFIPFIFVVTICMNIRWNRWYGLIFIDFDEMLDDFGLRCGLF